MVQCDEVLSRELLHGASPRRPPADAELILDAHRSWTDARPRCAGAPRRSGQIRRPGQGAGPRTEVGASSALYSLLCSTAESCTGGSEWHVGLILGWPKAAVSHSRRLGR